MPVYMIRAEGGDMKIGTAKDPLARMRQMQTGMPQKLRIVRVLEGSRAEEQGLHKRFAEYRLTGEWFKFHQDMLSPDLGLAELPIPFPKNGWDTEPVTASDRLRAFVNYLIHFVGGQAKFAELAGLAPWTLFHTMHHDHRVAALMLARQMGARETLRQLLDLEADEAAEVAESQRKIALAEKQRRLSYDRSQEAKWVKDHPGRSPWWPLYSERPDVVPQPAITQSDAAA
jgi:hypothetical protein